MSRILVAFATRAGSTGEVAAAIAQTLEECGDTVELRRARDVREPVWGWDCVVLGAPIYSGRWHRHAHRFLERHRRELGDVPVAVFGPGGVWPRFASLSSWRSPMMPGPKGRGALVRRVTSSAGAAAASPGRFAR